MVEIYFNLYPYDHYEYDACWFPLSVIVMCG